MQYKIFCVCEFIKIELATAVQRAFRLCFNIQPPTRKSICRWDHQFEQIGCLYKGKSSGQLRVSEERTWDEFKRVLSVAHASQPVERAENLKYRNRLTCTTGTGSFSLSFWITLYYKITYYTRDNINRQKFVGIMTRQQNLLQFVKTACPLSLVSSEYKELIGRGKKLVTLFQLILRLTISVIITALPQPKFGFYALNRDNFTFLFAYDNNNIYLCVKILCHTILDRVSLPRSIQTFLRNICVIFHGMYFSTVSCIM